MNESMPLEKQVANVSLAELLDRFTAEGKLYRREGEKVRCFACAHRCLLAEGQRGVCKVRFCRDGKLWVPFGYVAGVAVDPIEKKPFYHVLPGADALTFGMLGCNFHCPFCQNWITSQSLRDARSGTQIQQASPEGLVQLAIRTGAEAVISSYNEPMITAEWAQAIFVLAKEQGRVCGMVSNGYATPEALEWLRPYMDAYKVDLKSFREENYRQLGGSLKRVLEAIRAAHRLGYWVEIVTLLVPGFNDSTEELQSMAEFIVSVSPDIPWHITAFHPDYQMTDRRPTWPEDLERAAEIGRKAGLRFVYAGNLPGRVKGLENTYCPKCGTLLVERIGFSVLRNQIGPDGRCPSCGERIPGIWSAPAGR